MTLSRAVAFRVLIVSLVVTILAAGVAVFAVKPALWVVVVFGLIAFWYAIVQLIADTGRRVRNAVRDFTAEFSAAVGQQRGSDADGRRGAPVELGELKPIDD